ncbi:HNH endonuclease signature motif containing protein [Sphingobium ummariense]
MSDSRKPWASSSKKSRHQRGYGRAHERMRAHLLATVAICEACARKGITTPGVIADHIVPLAAGGTSVRENYQLLCRECDRAKLSADNGRVAHKRRRAIGADGWPIEDGE